jgi:hypothetical protein
MSTPRDAASKNPDEGKRGVLGITWCVDDLDLLAATTSTGY